ncbi:MAG: methylaspartate mutase accessory protein GlmL [Defluviitaleaceae bacterium]|nr:methylaspartate mutase accessory protein GlmL [Defluviitaleaceae bacterium]
MKTARLTDFGSTYTKITVLDMEKGKIIGFAKAHTTILTNVMEGFCLAQSEIDAQLGERVYTHNLACSSAAGGLKMVAIGLVPALTAKAARLAASSAGAKVMRTYSYELTDADIPEIAGIGADIILLSGGIDGGNKDVIVHNAQRIAQIEGVFSVLIAGNRSANQECAKILENAGKEVIICENVMPEFGKLNIDPAKDAIRRQFINNIVSAKGLDDAAAAMTDTIIPTPLAVYEALELLSRGAAGEAGLGELMAYDLGGATSDVYSMADGSPKGAKAYLSGILEPFAKRSVEGDVGMRYSLEPLYELIAEADPARLCRDFELAEEDVKNWMEMCRGNPAILPIGENARYAAIDEAFAALAIEISAARHVGHVDKVYTPAGEVLNQTGKDLTQVKYIIGSGGAVINAAEPAKILGYGVYHPRDGNLLKPINPAFLLDRENCMAAMGLLGRIAPEMAIKIMKEKFTICTK